jgi:tetratricopeptide (TPR) repeat protein
LSTPKQSVILEELKAAADAQARVAVCERALQSVSREEDPAFWANLHGMLASSLAVAHDYRFTQATFQRVLQSYRFALTAFSREESPEEWSATLRNIGQTFVDAAQSGLGDGHALVEAAIAAFGEAATVSATATPDMRFGALRDLASALRTAAEWQGHATLHRCIDAHEEIMRSLPTDASGGLRAVVSAQYAEAVVAAGDESRVGAAVRACETALETYTRERNPIDWAHVELMLGGLLRVQRQGNRADNLDRAAAALEAALTVFNESDFPAEWARAHYERGPVLVFRSHGDRNENLRQALESLRIALRAISRDHAPEQWGALQTTAAQALLDRTDGDPQAHIEEAIPVLEAALEALADRAGSLSWVLAKRFLGEALLMRRAGDHADNVERGIAALDAVQSVDMPPADIDAWTAAQANLGQAYAKQPGGDHGQNRAKAVATLEAALSIPFRDGKVTGGWGSALAWHTLLCMHDADYRFPTDPDEERRPGWDDRGRAALAAFHEGRQGLALDPNWHVPFQLEQDTLELQRELARFLASGEVPERDTHTRLQLEAVRSGLARRIDLQMRARLELARRTEALMDDIRVRRRPFALFLRGFNNRATRFAEGVVMKGTGNLEVFAITRIVDAIAPVPLVWIVNPVESPALDTVVGDRRLDDLGFPIEAGEGWEQHVRALVASASFIVMHNDRMTPGVVSEIELLSDLGRLGDTFFNDPDAANRATGRSDCRRDDSRALASVVLRAAPSIEASNLPPASCPWVGGSRRGGIEREASAIQALDQRLRAAGEPALAELELDVCAALLAYAVLLERREEVPALNARRVAVLQRVECPPGA